MPRCRGNSDGEQRIVLEHHRLRSLRRITGSLQVLPSALTSDVACRRLDLSRESFTNAKPRSPAADRAVVQRYRSIGACGERIAGGATRDPLADSACCKQSCGQRPPGPARQPGEPRCSPVFRTPEEPATDFAPRARTCRSRVCYTSSGRGMLYPTPRSVNIQTGSVALSPSLARSFFTNARTAPGSPESRPSHTRRSTVS